MNKEQNNFKKV